MSRVRVYIACSLDGFIAGPDDDLSWLDGADGQASEEAKVKDPGALEFDAFIAEIGALLMGRRTYQVLEGFDIEWPYGERPVLVATHRELTPLSPTVRAVSGDIAELVAEAKEAAGEKDVYIDGGNLIRQALDAGLVDDLVVTVAPVVLGRGHPLFAGAVERHRFTLVSHHRYAGNMAQLRYRPQES